MTSSLIGVASTNFAYFYWYSVVRSLYLSSSPGILPSQSSSAAVELLLGAAAGALAQVFTIPVSVVTTRQQTQPKGERKKGLFETGREVVNGEDGWTGLWRGLKASLVLVINPAITYGAYQKLKEILFPAKSSLRPWEAFGKSPSFWARTECWYARIVTLALHGSPRSIVQGHRHDRHSTPDRCQSRATITTATRTARQAVQEFHRGDDIYSPTRRHSWIGQRHGTAAHERLARARHLDDDQGEVSTCANRPAGKFT